MKLKYVLFDVCAKLETNRIFTYGTRSPVVDNARAARKRCAGSSIICFCIVVQVQKIEDSDSSGK